MWSVSLGVLVAIVFVACSVAQTFVSAATNSANLFAIYDQKHNTVSGKLHIFDYFIDKGTFHGHLLLDLNRIDRVNEEPVFIIVNERRAVHFHNEFLDARLL